MNHVLLRTFVEDHGLDVQWSPSGMACSYRCPLHDDTRPSARAWVGDDNRVRVCCFAGCEQRALEKHFGLKHRRRSSADVVLEYYYHDRFGSPIYGVSKAIVDGVKQFKQFRLNKRNGYEKIWNMKGVEPVLYALPTLDTAPSDTIVFVVEGEKDAERLLAQGIVATTSVGGARGWSRTDSTPLADRAS